MSERQHASFFSSASESILYRTAANNSSYSSSASADAQPHAAEPLHAATQEAIDSGEERHRGLDSHEIPTMALFLGPPSSKADRSPRGCDQPCFHILLSHGTLKKKKGAASKITYDMLVLNSFLPHKDRVCWGGVLFFFLRWAATGRSIESASYLLSSPKSVSESSNISTIVD